MRSIHNLINGKLKSAKASAKTASFSKIMDSAHFAYGMPLAQAILTAKFLKNEITYQKYCIAMSPQRKLAIA